MAPATQIGGRIDGGEFDLIGAELRIGGGERLDLIAVGDQVGDVMDRNPRGLETRRAGHDLRIAGGHGLGEAEPLQAFVDVGRDPLPDDDHGVFLATEVDQFVLSYNATLGDRWGQSALKNDLVYGPGGLTGGNTTAAFQNSGVAGASATYVYDRVQLTRQTNLPYHVTWLVRATGQTASNDLILSEQLGAGGVDSVRGYDERAESGSEGVLVSTELYTPALSLAHALLGKSFNDAGQLLAFYDYGHVSDEHPQQKTPTQAELESVGFGARYNLDRYLSVRFDYGWQLERLPGAAHLGNLAMVSVTTGY